jgi:hypothetical protein
MIEDYKIIGCRLSAVGRDGSPRPRVGEVEIDGVRDVVLTRRFVARPQRRASIEATTSRVNRDHENATTGVAPRKQAAPLDVTIA